MTKNERWLLAAAKDAKDLLAARIAGNLPRGMYDDLGVARNLTAAIAAVDADEAADEDDTEAQDAEGDVEHEPADDDNAWSGGFAENH